MVLRLGLETGRMVGSVMATFGSILIAQARAEDIERWVAGGVIALIGVFLVRWALKTSERVESTYVAALASANDRAERAREDAQHYRSLWEHERGLRMALEQAGLHRPTYLDGRNEETTTNDDGG